MVSFKGVRSLTAGLPANGDFGTKIEPKMIGSMGQHFLPAKDTNTGTILEEEEGGSQGYGWTVKSSDSFKFSPRPFVDDFRVDKLGSLDTGRMTSLAALHEEGRWDVFSSAPLPPPALLRNFCNMAGVHVYCHENAAVFRGGNVIALIAMSDGTHNLTFPSPSRLADLYSGEVLAGNATEYQVSMRTGETLLLEVLA